MFELIIVLSDSLPAIKDKILNKPHFSSLPHFYRYHQVSGHYYCLKSLQLFHHWTSDLQAPNCLIHAKCQIKINFSKACTIDLTKNKEPCVILGHYLTTLGKNHV